VEDLQKASSQQKGDAMKDRNYFLRPSVARTHRQMYQTSVSDHLFQEVAIDVAEFERLRAKACYLQVFYDAALKINSTLDQHQVGESIARSITEAMNVKACSILLLNSDRSQLIHSTTYGLSEGYLAKGPVYVDRSMAEAMKGQAVAVYDVINDPRIQYPEEKAKEGIASILSVPMRRGGEIIGVMRVYSAEPREFTKDEIEFMTALASVGALSIGHAVMYSTLREQYEALRHNQIPWAENFNKPSWRG
jgi:GAF domain-containing protein